MIPAQRMSLIGFIEVASVLILAGAGVAAARRGRLRVLAEEGVLTALGGLLGELSILHVYGFYRYADGWSSFVDLMPLMVALVWGYVIASARELAAFIDPRRPPWLVGAIVLFDAALIEPVASRAGLWTWDDGGLWSVPWIGWLGWGIYAAAASYCLDRPRWRRLTPLVAPVLTHVGLLATWWGALRWIARDAAPDAVLVTASVVVALALSIGAMRVRPLPLLVLLPRAPAGLLFFGLLPVVAPTPAFLLYVAPFLGPWAVLMVRAFAASTEERLRDAA